MDNITKSIQTCLDKENWYGALIIALIIPDICSSLELGDTNGKVYAAWFDKYLDNSYSGHMTGDDCYALRCSILHQGVLDVSHQRVQVHKKTRNASASVIDRFSFGTSGSHLISLPDVVLGGVDDGVSICHLDVSTFCRDIIKSAERWLLGVQAKPDVQKRISELPNINSNVSLYGGNVQVDNHSLFCDRPSDM